MPLIFMIMRTTKTTTPPDECQMTQRDVDTLIKDINEDIANERKRENEINWLRYIFPALRSQATDICDALGMSPDEKQAVITGKIKSHDPKWKVIKSKVLPKNTDPLSDDK